MKFSYSSYLPTLLISLLLVLFVSYPLALATQNVRLWVLIEEKTLSIPGTSEFEKSGMAEATLIEEFLKMGYRVVDSATAHKNITQTKGLVTLVNDPQAAAAVGLQYGAQFSVIGTAISKIGRNELLNTKLKSIHASVSVRIIRNDDARILAAGSATASEANLDEIQGGALAIRRASLEVAKKLNAYLKAAMAVDAPGANELAVHISGLKSYRHLDFILAYLEIRTPGIGAVELQNFTYGVSELLVTYEGSMHDLASHLAHEKFAGFRLEPVNVVSNRIDLKVVLEKE